MACLEPIAEGLHLTHWTSTDLAYQAIEKGIVEDIHLATIRQLLQEVALQPHRTRSWRTVQCDAQYRERAEKILWCYAQAIFWAQQQCWVVCTE